MDPQALLKQARQEQTQHELDQLAGELRDWLGQCRGLDRDENGSYLGRHKTQLEAIESVVLGALLVLQDQLKGLDLARPPGDVYDDCRDYDMAVVWARRLWTYYRGKFDQRLDSERMGTLLRAADEVVWSCYRQVFVRAPELTQGAPPLPFFEPAYAPGAIVAGRLPATLNLFVDLPFLTPFLARLPVPVLQLPPWCADAPWWLVYIGHEVGHFIQKDLGLEQHFRQGVVAAAQGALANEDRRVREQDQKRWEAWQREIFADIFSLAVMGPWALYAIREAEWGGPAAMAARKDEYPAPAIRLAIMAEAARKLGLDVSAMLADLDLPAAIASSADTTRDEKVIPGLVEFALGPLPGNLGTLALLGNFDPEAYGPDGGRVERWSAALRGQGNLVVSRKLRTARELACGSLSAWTALVASSGAAQRRAAAATLAERTQDGLIRSAEGGMRGPFAPDGRRPQAALELAGKLLQASRERRDLPLPAAQGADEGGAHGANPD